VETEQVVKAWVRGWTELDFALLTSLCAPDMVERSALGEAPKERATGFWPRMAREWEQTFELGDMLIQRWTERGRATGPFEGKKGSGQPFEQIYMEFLEIEHGLVQVRWSCRDTNFFFKQLGW